MPQLTIEDLTQIASDFLRDEYGLALEIPIKRNNRLKRALGRFVEEWDTETKSHSPNRIEISGESFEYAVDSGIIDTLKHELVHYALCVKGEPYDDGDPHFEAELSRLGISGTETVTVGKYVIYQCGKCALKDFTRQPKAVKRLSQSTKGWTTRCCNASLTCIEIVIFDGTKSVNELFTEVNAK